MTETVTYRCKHCGNRFEAQVLTQREQREAKHDRRPVYAVHCPQCGSRDIQRV
jgi:DNA-directed RNA polymerase subunit RPC12/RpoP